jgi:hypothetical protein
MENGELKMDNAWGMEDARALLIIFHYPFVIFNSHEARNDTAFTPPEGEPLPIPNSTPLRKAPAGP